MIIAMDLTAARLAVARNDRPRGRGGRPMDPAVAAALSGKTEAGPDALAAAVAYLGSSALPEGTPLRDLAGQVRSVVVCLPDEWFRAGAGSAPARELLTRALKDGLGLPAPRFLHRGSGNGAGLGEPGVWLLADAGEAVDLTLAEVTAHGIVVLGSWHGDLPAGHRAPPEIPSENLRRFRERAEVVLPRALAAARYRTTPVYPGYGAGWTTAGAVLDWYEPVAAAIVAGTGALFADVPPARARRWAHLGGLRFALGGALRSVPVAGDTMAEALPAAVRCREGRAAMLPGRAALDGALEIAVQGLDVREFDVVRATLNTHRVVGGRLRAQTVALTAANRPDGISAYHEGELVTVTAAAAQTAEVEVVRADSAGGHVRTLATGHETVPAGTFHVGYWPDHGLGTLALRPVGGGTTRFLPLRERMGVL